MSDLIRKISDLIDKNINKPPKEPRQGCLGTVAVISGILGGSFTVSGLYHLLFAAGVNYTQTLLLLVFGGLVPLGLCATIWYIIHQNRQKFKLEYAHWLENSLLKCALRREGRITATEAAVELDIQTQTAEAALDEMLHKGIADILVAETGTKVYKIRGLGEDKFNAEEI
ncbi:MAG: hypothetical protein D6675_10325 [Gemmatimonadetes bacterium]|nr:MAG: hypothetical protein D6675_10325 [Gemmatimonadota bacterium]